MMLPNRRGLCIPSRTRQSVLNGGPSLRAARHTGLAGTKVEPLLKSLHGDPRYTRIFEQVATAHSEATF